MLAGAVVAVMIAVFLPAHFDEEALSEQVSAGSYLGPESVTRINEALELLEAGLPL